jgi:integrase
VTPANSARRGAVADATLRAEPDPREGFYEPEEFIKFQQVARSIPRCKNFDGEVVADIVLFSYYSDWRLTECLRLHKDWIKVHEKIAVLPKSRSKNKKPRIFPLEGVVWEMVESRLSNANGDGLLFHRNGKAVRSIRKLCKTVCEIAEINSQYFFHNLRRSATTNLNRSGVDKETGKKITGHVTDAMYNQYNQASLNQLRGAMQKVQSYVDLSIQNQQVNSLVFCRR